ncbi:MAG TPA: hypothetical protein VH592_21130 [Gemmataceae bacterium]
MNHAHELRIAELENQVAVLLADKAVLLDRVRELEAKEERRRRKIPPEVLANYLELKRLHDEEGVKDLVLANRYKLSVRQIRYRRRVAEENSTICQSVTGSRAP